MIRHSTYCFILVLLLGGGSLPMSSRASVITKVTRCGRQHRRGGTGEPGVVIVPVRPASRVAASFVRGRGYCTYS